MSRLKEIDVEINSLRMEALDIISKNVQYCAKEQLDDALLASVNRYLYYILEEYINTMNLALSAINILSEEAKIQNTIIETAVLQLHGHIEKIKRIKWNC